jgi:repressor LexA
MATDMEPLTVRQQEIYDFIASRIAADARPPTVREVGLRFQIRSPNGVTCHLKALERKGHIVLDGCTARGIRLTAREAPEASAGEFTVLLRVKQQIEALTPDEADALAQQLLEAAGDVRRKIEEGAST